MADIVERLLTSTDSLGHAAATAIKELRKKLAEAELARDAYRFEMGAAQSTLFDREQQLLATRLRDELAKGREPIGWLYTDAYGTHYTDEKREWYDAVGIEEVTPLYTRPFVAAPAGVMDFEPDAKRLALELECLLLDCKDMAAVSKWWDSAHEALEQHRAMLSAATAAPEINGLPEATADAVKNIQEPVAFLKRYPSKCQLKVEFEDAVTELAEGTYALYTNPFSSTPYDAVAKDALPPIERDEEMDRTYIPLPGGWEIQTKGRGSTFRICDTKDGQRWAVMDTFMHKALEKMAADIRAAVEGKGPSA